MSGLKKGLLMFGVPVRPTTKKNRNAKKQLAELRKQTELMKRQGK